MLPGLETIALRRRALGLTQTQLADLASVSQSYIAKLEANKIEPSYTKVKAILEALEGLERGREARAKDIMTAHIIGVQSGDQVQKVVALMDEYGFSQLPVFDGERPVGSITERTIVDRIVRGEGKGPIGGTPVSELMDDPFPQVGEDAPISLIANMLRVYPAALVHSKGEVTGIITKADLLKAIT